MGKIDEGLVFKNATIADIEGYERVFEDCTFSNCDFSYADFSNMIFINCVMDTCNLSLVKVINTGLQSLHFKNCKVTGVNFSASKSFSFSVSFEGCTLDYSIFHKRKLKETTFTDCTLVECDFTEADLTKSVFFQCDLNRTVFNRSILKGVDFRTASNFNIDPEINTLIKAKFSSDSLGSLLTKYNLIIE